MDTISEVRSILKEISEKTDTFVSLEPFDGATKFGFTFGGKDFEAYLAGTGGEAEKQARLVAFFLASAERGERGDRREELVHILRGEGGAWRAFRYMNRYGILDGICFALEILPDKRFEGALSLAERCVSERDIVVGMEDRIAVVRFPEADQSPYEFGQFLSQSLYEELGVRASVGVGCEMRSFSEIALSYGQAAMAVRMSGIFHSEGEVHSYREYLLVRMLEDVPKSRLKEYMEQFRIEGTEEVFGDEDMALTAEEFLESSLNISETSRNLFMHRNTLTYRLDKIERATGLNIRKFSDAVTFRVITILYKLLKN